MAKHLATPLSALNPQDAAVLRDLRRRIGEAATVELFGISPQTIDRAASENALLPSTYRVIIGGLIRHAAESEQPVATAAPAAPADASAPAARASRKGIK